MYVDPDYDEYNEAPAAPSWLLTYSDVATLLLTFFVMLVAISQVESSRFQQVFDAFASRKPAAGAVPIAVMPAPSPAAAVTAGSAYANLTRYLQQEKLDHSVRVTVSREGLEVVLPDGILFDNGSAALSMEARELLRRIGPLVEDQVQSVVVEGHSDNVPIVNERYPSNWELSAARAAAVARFLLAQPGALPPAAYTAVGLGENHPLDSNETAAGRARNRRIEIMLSWKTWQSIRKQQPFPNRPALQ